MPGIRLPPFSRARWIEIAGGAFVVLLLAWLVSFIVLDQREWTNRTTCLSNLRQIGQALHQYVEDYDGCWPDSGAWMDQKIGKPGVLQGCPSAKPMLNLPGLKNAGIPGYAYNRALSIKIKRGVLTPTRSRDIAFPATTVSVCEEAIGIPTTTEIDPYKNAPARPQAQEKGWLRHGGGALPFLRRARAVAPSRTRQGSDGPGGRGEGQRREYPLICTLRWGRAKPLTMKPGLYWAAAQQARRTGRECGPSATSRT